MDDKGIEGKVRNEGITRRDFIKLGVAAGMGLAAFSVSAFPNSVEAQKIPGSKTAQDSINATKGGTLRYRLYGDPPILDPQMTLAANTQRFASQPYSRLIRCDFGEGVDANNRDLLPDLAERWEQTDDLTYKFYLKKGVKFHNLPPVNGRELVSDDIKFSFERHLNPATGSPVVHHFSEIASIELPDKHTVVLKTKEPFAPMLTYLGSQFAWILPREVIEKEGDAKKTVIGTGPFILEEYVRNNRLSFRKHPDYFWSGHPHVDHLDMLIIKDPSQAMAAFRGKQLDINYLNTKVEANELKQTFPEARITKFMLGNYTFIMFNTEKPPFDNIKVRQAINHALNRQAMVEIIDYGESGFSATIPPSMPDLTLSADETAHLYRHDLDLARKLLKDAGISKGTEITLNVCEVYGTFVMDTAVLIQEHLGEIGLKVIINRREYGAYLKDWKEGTFHFNYGPQTIFTEADEWTYGQFHSKAPRNFSRARDGELDKKLEAQRRILDKGKRKKLLDEIQRDLAAKAYQLPLTYMILYYTVQPNVKNFGGPFASVSLDDTWIEKV